MRLYSRFNVQQRHNILHTQHATLLTISLGRVLLFGGGGGVAEQIVYTQHTTHFLAILLGRVLLFFLGGGGGVRGTIRGLSLIYRLHLQGSLNRERQTFERGSLSCEHPETLHTLCQVSRDTPPARGKIVKATQL